MNKETILSFINEVIIENGIDKDLDAETIKKSITDYKKYLTENGLGTEDVLNAISIIEENIHEYIKLVKSFKKAGLPLPTIQIPTIPTVKNNDVKEQEKNIHAEKREKATQQDYCSSPNLNRSSC